MKLEIQKNEGEVKCMKCMVGRFTILNREIHNHILRKITEENKDRLAYTKSRHYKEESISALRKIIFKIMALLNKENFDKDYLFSTTQPNQVVRFIPIIFYAERTV